MERRATGKPVCIHIALLFVTTLLGSASGQYSMKVHLSSVTSVEGGQLKINCEVTNRNRQKNSFFIVWVKRTHGDYMEIGTNDHVNEIFVKTGRYRAKYILQHPNDYNKVNFYLTISNLTSTDSGEIGCRIPTNVEILKQFTVIVRATSVRLLSRDIDNTHTAVAYEDGQNVTFTEGEKRKFYCYVNGSYPQPEVKVTVGSRDLTHLFDVSAELVKDGEVIGLQSFYYSVELINDDLQIAYDDFSHETMTCTARDPDHVLPAKTSSINIHLSGYPKFRCSRQSIAKIYEKNISVSCPVVAEPPIKTASVRWKRLTQEHNVTMKAGTSDGHYTVRLFDGTSELEKIITLIIDKAYPQTFRTYIFEATNDLGYSAWEMDLLEPGSV